MADGEQKRYPQAFLAQGNGDFVSCTNFSIKTTNNAKQIHTLREKGSGFTLGKTESTVSADLVVSEDGPERNFYRQLQTFVEACRASTLPFCSLVEACNTQRMIDAIYTSAASGTPVEIS